MVRWSNMAAGCIASSGCCGTRAWMFEAKALSPLPLPVLTGRGEESSLCRGLFHRVVACKQMQQRALDRGLPRRRVDLRAQQIGDVEHVAGALAESRHM